MKHFIQPLKVITLALILSVGISYVSAWTAPSATPPSSNVAAPVNVSSTAQIKTGDFSAWNLISNGVVTNNAVVTNSIAGNTVATNNLVVATGAAAGKVLTSDATGNATWQIPASSGVTSLTAGSGISLSGSTGVVTVSSTGGGKTGLQGLFYPLRGMSISCGFPGSTAQVGSASVDANGNITLGAYHKKFLFAWDYCTGVSSCGGGFASDGFTTTLTQTGISAGVSTFGETCTANWPAS